MDRSDTASELPVMAEQTLPIEHFYGGRSLDKVLGPKASFSYDRAVEFRADPSQLTVLPQPQKISESVIEDLVLNIVQSDDGSRYAFDRSGNFYKVDINNKVTKISSPGNPNAPTAGSDGLLYRDDSDAIYAASDVALHRYYPMSGTPTWDQVYGASKSTDSNAYRTGGANIYSVPVSSGTLSEAPTDLFTFNPDIEPGYSVKVNVVTKGTGNLTLTLHDGIDDVLATVTIPNASLTTGLNEFKFPAQVRMYVKPNARTYHCHLTSTIVGTTVRAATTANLSTADFEFWAYRFVKTNNGYHPICQWLQYTCIGNANYLAVWEPLSPSDPPNNEFQRHRLTFPTGFEVCALDRGSNYLFIGAAKFSTDGNREFQEGMIFLWDGFSQTYYDDIQVTGGSPESLRVYNNYPYFFVKGTLTAWLGGENTTPILTMPNSSNAYKSVTTTTRTYPNVMCIKDNLLHAGFPSITGNPVIEFGIYTWGTLHKDYPSSFGYGYVPSTMVNDPTDPSANREIGCVRNFGDDMYICWKDGANYGIDLVNSASPPASVFKFRSLAFTGGVTVKTKQALRFAIDAQALPGGITITPVSQKNNDNEVTYDSTFMAVSERDGDIASANYTRALSVVDDGRFNRFIFGFDGTSDGATDTPVIYAPTLVWDPLSSERMI